MCLLHGVVPVAVSCILYFMSLLHSVVSVVVSHILYVRSLLHDVVPVAVSCILCHASVTRCSAGSCVLYFMSFVCYTV